MRVIRKEPGRGPEIVEIDNTLEALQAQVGGYIETVTQATDCCIICNEEGRLLGLPENLYAFGHRWVGTILLVGVDGDEFTDVPNEQFLLSGLNNLNRRTS